MIEFTISEKGERPAMLAECLRQIFESRNGPELVGASRLARALAEVRGAAFDALVADYADSELRPPPD